MTSLTNAIYERETDSRRGRERKKEIERYIEKEKG